MPVVLMTITNIWILFVAAKFAKSRTGEFRPRKAAVITVSSICWIFNVSYIPTFVRMVMDTPSWFTYFAVYALSVSVVGNPIIYTATNNRFRCFVKTIIVVNWRKLSRNTVAVVRSLTRKRKDLPRATTPDLSPHANCELLREPNINFQLTTTIS